MTGVGVVSPIGNNVKSAWRAAVSGQSGIRRITNLTRKVILYKLPERLQTLI